MSIRAQDLAKTVGVEAMSGAKLALVPQPCDLERYERARALDWTAHEHPVALGPPIERAFEAAENSGGLNRWNPPYVAPSGKCY